MSRRYVKQLGQQESVNEVFLASGKQLRPNRNGNLYLQVDLSDKTGMVGGRMWNATEANYRSFDDGDYVSVDGTTQLFQGAVQLIITRIGAVRVDEVIEEDFVPLGTIEVERLRGRLTEILRGLTNPALRNLGEVFLLDEAFMDKFVRAPAGIKHHHAYAGGLMEHVVNLMEVAGRIAPCYPQIDRDLLVLGAFLHDVGKVDELCYERDFSYSDEGQMIGHLVMGIGMIETKVREAERLSGDPIPDETVLRLKHMLISHHGRYEYGSPKPPMTLEAVALYCLDSLDSKISAFHQVLRDDPNVDSRWTHYHPTLGRKLFKGDGSS